MSSCLYECQVMHHRLQPRPHRFHYRIFLFLLELDELEWLDGSLALFSRNRANLYSFHDRDHFSGAPGHIRSHLESFLHSQGVALPPRARVQLLTLTRVLGYVFNPVAFYFCHEENGAPLCAVAEVGNTFGEKKLYLVPPAEGEGRFRLVAPKHFYVSPFSELDLQFDFQLRTPGERLELRVDDRRGDSLVLRSLVAGQRRELTSANLAWFALKYPLLTLKVIASIHWEALRLWWKRLPFFSKSAEPGLQRQVLRPHRSLTQPPA